MKKLLAACALCLALSASASADVARVVSWDRTSVTIEITAPDAAITPLEGPREDGRLSRVDVAGFFNLDSPGSCVLPARRFIVAVPGLENVRLDILSADSYAVEGVLPRVALEDGSAEAQRSALAKAPALAGQSFARLSGVERWRGAFCAFVDVRPVLFDGPSRRLSCVRRLVVRVSFPPAPAQAGGAARGAAADAVLNPEQAATWGTPLRAARAARTPFEFALSSSWVRVTVKDRGLYILTHGDLLAAGADPDAIDPATLRLFSTSPHAEPDSIRQGGSFLEGSHLVEHAILYRGSGAGSFQPGDTIFFYGIPVDGWANDDDPAASPREYYKHPYDTANVYWLAWGGSFPGAPRRMAQRNVAPTAAPDTTIAWYEERIHTERDLNYDPIYADDRWYWTFLKMNGSTSYFPSDFYTSDIADAWGVLKTKASGPYNQACRPDSDPAFNCFESATYRINNAIVGTLEWQVPVGYHPSWMKTLEAVASNIVEGRNLFSVTKPVNKEMYVFGYDIFYHRLLKASGGVLDFHVPERPLTARYTLSGFPPAQKLLFDVTEDESPVLCTGAASVAGGIVFQDSLAGRARHYAAVSSFKRVRRADLKFASVPSLRDEGPCPDMVIIYHGNFRTAALLLKNHRERWFPDVENPVVRAVDVADVYNNFSGGRKDPIAIRNYLKFLYDNGACAGGGAPTLKYALLIGNGTYDPRNRLDQGNDFVPLYVNVRYPGESEGVEDDDYLVKLDGADRLPDVAIGRMTVLTDREATAWARRIVDYEERPDLGPWRDKTILVADDEFSSTTDCDFGFMSSMEQLARKNGPFPAALDLHKLYLHLYPFSGDVKPKAREDLIKDWSDGALIVAYNGHGSPLQMADERVMVSSDIYSLTNADRRPLFLSFSCSVGDLESPFHRSMAQNLVTYDAGGAIGTISASGPTLGFWNDFLQSTIFEKLFPSRDRTTTRAVGYALELTKADIIFDAGMENNCAKYALLGDPALRLAGPAYQVVHEVAPIDTMRTGGLYRVTGAVMSGGEVVSSFNGAADVTIQESGQVIHEIAPAACWSQAVDYTIPGKELFRGTVDVVGGRFTAEFVVPRRCHTGPGARIRTYASATGIDGAGAVDTLRILQADTLRRDLEPPTVHLYFAGQATKVKAGAKLIADLSDPDGIAILGSDPQSSIFLEFDGSGYPVYVTDYFTYDHGSYTTGRVEYPLAAGFEPGPHSVLIKAFDNLGLAASDTLKFEIVEEGLYQVSDVFNLPNPFSRTTNFVFQVSNPADVKLSVYTVSGVRVWESRLAALEGFNSIYWDGRDLAGDSIANGTYLYVLEVEFRDSFHREETVRGKVVYLR